MKQYRPAILIGFIALWAFMFTKCTDQPPGKEEQSKMSFAAGIVAQAPDSFQIIGKDTLKWYHTTKAVTYDVPYAVFVPGSSGPIDTTINKPPTADAGPAREITLPTKQTTLTGAANDPDGNIATIQWTLLTGQSGVQIVTPNLLTTTVSFTAAGNYSFKLRVSDNDGAVNEATTSVKVNPIGDTSTGSTRIFSVPIISTSNTDLVAPGRGAEQWHDRVDVNVPSEGTKTIPLDRYQRFVATRIANATRGSYNWSFFDNLVSQCIANNQKFSFGYMTVYTDGTTNEGLVRFSDGSLAAYPEWVHTAMMQNGGPKPWKYGNYNIPNYNNTAYLDWLLEFNKAIDSHIKSTTISGVLMKNVVNIIDIRGMGNWGEWHHYPYVGDYPNKLPAGQQPTFASLKRIVDAFLLGFPDNPLVAMISAHDRERLVNTWNPPAISDYLATTRNNWGGIGYRNDHWGGLDTYTWDYLDHSALANVWKTGYITGEPPGSVNGTNNMGDLVRQMTKYHGTSFGNGNMGGGESNSTVRNNIRAASKITGYRLQVTAGSITTGAAGKISLTWQNIGIAPTYENWNTVLELKSGSTVVWTGESKFKAKLFLPGTIKIDDTFANIPTTPGLVLTVKLVDPTGYRKPLMLANTRNVDGSYTLLK